MKRLALSGVLVVVLLEVALRMYQPIPFRLRGDRIVLPVGLKYQFANPDNSKVDQETIHTRNRLGFRGPEVPSDFAARLTIVAVGGSTTECFPISDGKTWPEIVGAHLSRVRSDVWVNNAGLDGHSTVGHLALLRGTLVPLKPKVMLVLAGVNDVGLDALRPEDEVSGIYPYFRPAWQRFAEYSEMANLVLNIERARRARGMAYRDREIDIRALQRQPMSDAELDARVTRMTRYVDRYAARLSTLAAEAQAAGILPVFLTQPSLAGEGIDPTTGADLATFAEDGDGISLADWRALEHYNEAMRAVAARHGILVIDLASRLPKDSRYFYDQIHFGNEGSVRVGQIVGEVLAPYLEARWPARR